MNAESARSSHARVAARLDAIMSTSSQALVFIDDEVGGLVNAAAARLLGLPIGVVEHDRIRESMRTLRSRAIDDREIEARDMLADLDTTIDRWRWSFSVPETLHLRVTSAPVRAVASGEATIRGRLWTFDDVTTEIEAERASRDSEARVRAIFENAAVGVTVVDDKGAFLDVNGAFERFIGYTAAELIGLPSSSLSIADDVPLTRAAVAALASGAEQQVVVDKRWIRKDGDVKWGALTLSRITFANGRTGHVGIITDLTARRQAEEEAARQQAYLDAVLESMSDGVLACDANGRLMLSNRVTRKLLGLPDTPGAQAGWPVHYALFRADGVSALPPHEVPLLRVLQGDVVHDEEFVVVPNGLAPRRLVANGEMIRDARGASLGAVVALSDITKRAHADAAVRASEARLSLIYNSASDAMFLLAVRRDQKGNITQYECESVNDAFFALFGQARVDVIGKTPEEFAPAIAVRALEHFAYAVESATRVDYEETVNLPDRLYTLEITITPVFDDETNAVTQLLCAARDVTARREAEQALRHSEWTARASEERFRTALEGMVDAFYILRPVYDGVGGVDDFAIVEINSAGAARMGMSISELIGTNLGELIPLARLANLFEIYRGVLSTGERFHGEFQEVDPRYEGAWLHLQVARTAEGLAVTARDISDTKKAEVALRELAVRDELTQLLNRRGFRQFAEQEFRIAKREKRTDAVLCLDLDRFKAINDTFGHAEGDRALQEMASILRATLRQTDIIARAGGDEFVIYAPALSATGEAAVICDRLRAAFAAANADAVRRGRAYSIDSAIGVAEIGGEEQLDELLSRADQSLYASKTARRSP